MIASAGARRKTLGCRCGSISLAPPSKTMKAGMPARSVRSPIAVAPVPSVRSIAALRSTASRALASAVAGLPALSRTTSLSGCFAFLKVKPPRALSSSTACSAPLRIDVATHGSVETGALTTIVTVSLSSPHPAAVSTRTSMIRPIRSIGPSSWRRNFGSLEGVSALTVRPAALAAVLFAVLALVFSACGRDDETPSGSGAEAPATTTATATATATEDADAGEEGQQGEDGDSEEEREKEEQEAREAGTKECDQVGDLDGEPKNQPPDDVVILQGAKVYESEGPFGKTERFFAAVDGEAADLPQVRDEAAQQLEGVGFKSLSTDQEENTEAEAHLQGDKHTVDIQVITFCTGKLRIRYTVS